MKTHAHLLALACTVILFSPNARSQEPVPEHQPSKFPANSPINQVRFALKNGKMWIINDAGTLPMEKNAVLDDGSSLVADGTILRKNGQVFILDEGDAIRIDGVIEPAGLGSDQVGMKYGIMWTMVNGKSLLLEKDLTLANGITVMVDGTVIMKDKTTLKIQEGQTLTPDGKIGNGALQVDHITLKGGKVWARKNGETMMQEGNFTLDNGTRIAPNGIVSLPDGKSATLAEGDVVLPTGQIVRSGPTSAVPD